jgi:hypothetical protein
MSCNPLCRTDFSLVETLPVFAIRGKTTCMIAQRIVNAIHAFEKLLFKESIKKMNS